MLNPCDDFSGDGTVRPVESRDGAEDLKKHRSWAPMLFAKWFGSLCKAPRHVRGSPESACWRSALRPCRGVHVGAWQRHQLSHARKQ